MTEPASPAGTKASALKRRKRKLLTRLRIPPDALPGSLVLSHRRCGKPGCHCAEGTAHPFYSLTFMVAGKKHVESVPAEWIDAVRPAVDAAQASRMPSPSCLPSTLNCSCSPANSGVDMFRSTDRRSEKEKPHGAAAPTAHGTGGTTATAPARRSAVALCSAGARSGVGVQAPDVRSLATQGQHGGGRGPRYGTGVSTMRPAHDLSRYASGFLAGALGAASGLCGTVPLLALQTGTSTLVGSF